MSIYELMSSLKDRYTFNENIKDFDLIIKERDEHYVLTCLFRDTYGIKNKSVYFIASLEDFNEEHIRNWVETLIDGVVCIKRLNDKLKDIYEDSSCIHVYFRYSLKNEFKSYIYDWDYDTILVALSRKSIHQLCSIVDDLEISKNSITTYTKLEDFITKYKESDILCDINLELDSINIYEALSKHMNDRDTVINIIKNAKDQHNKIEVTSVLACESLGIVCKFKWNIDFDNLDIKVNIENNKVYSIKNNEFIRDSEILNGIEKLYKLTASEITDILR